MLSDLRWCSNIVTLSLHGLPLVEDTHVRSAFEHMKQLQQLDVHDCPRITSKAIAALGLANPNRFRLFRVASCAGIDTRDLTIGFVAPLVARLKKLVHLALPMSEIAKIELAKKFPGVRFYAWYGRY